MPHIATWTGNQFAVSITAVQVLFAWELQRRTGGRVVSVALHPGEVMTHVVRSLPGPLQRAYRLLLQAILLTPQQGRRTDVVVTTGWVKGAEQRPA